MDGVGGIRRVRVVVVEGQVGGGRPKKTYEKVVQNEELQLGEQSHQV